MKKTFLLFLILLSIFSCSKENGKNPYDLIFSFDNGEYVAYEVRILEKEKSYVTGYGNHVVAHSGSKDFIIVIPVEKTAPFFQFNFIKQNDQGFYCNTIHEFYINSQFINGNLILSGEYSKKGKKYSVENGTFTIDWSNAADYGEPVQELTGTWSLKRK